MRSMICLGGAVAALLCATGTSLAQKSGGILKVYHRDNPPRPPKPSRLVMLASGLSPIYPCHVSPGQMRARPIGTGPFKLAQFSEFQYIRLVRNPDYWKKGRPYLDGIDFNIVSNPSTAILSFIAGRFDLTFPWEVTPADRKLVQKDAPQAICETTS